MTGFSSDTCELVPSSRSLIRQAISTPEQSNEDKDYSYFPKVYVADRFTPCNLVRSGLLMAIPSPENPFKLINCESHVAYWIEIFKYFNLSRSNKRVIMHMLWFLTGYRGTPNFLSSARAIPLRKYVTA